MDKVCDVIHSLIVNHPFDIWQCCHDLFRISVIFIQQFHKLSTFIIWLFTNGHFYLGIGVIVHFVPWLMSKDSTHYFSYYQCRYRYYSDNNSTYYFSFKVCSNNHISFTKNIQNDSENLVKLLDQMDMLAGSFSVNLQDYTHNMLNYDNCQDYYSNNVMPFNIIWKAINLT